MGASRKLLDHFDRWTRSPNISNFWFGCRRHVLPSRIHFDTRPGSEQSGVPGSLSGTFGPLALTPDPRPLRRCAASGIAARRSRGCSVVHGPHCAGGGWKSNWRSGVCVLFYGGGFDIPVF